MGLLNPRRNPATTLRLWKSAAIAVSLAAGGLSLACLASSPAPPLGSALLADYDPASVVRFERGATRGANGDQITIDRVTGTSDQLTAGNTYVIEGTYRLASRQRATLLASVTAVNPDRPWEGINVPKQPLQQVELGQGAGRFKLRLYMGYEGQPHVSFYPAEGGESFANAYFGTGESVARRGWWETAK